MIKFNGYTINVTSQRETTIAKLYLLPCAKLLKLPLPAALHGVVDHVLQDAELLQLPLQGTLDGVVGHPHHEEVDHVDHRTVCDS